jgi:hypothetical protein
MRLTSAIFAMILCVSGTAAAQDWQAAPPPPPQQQQPYAQQPYPQPQPYPPPPQGYPQAQPQPYYGAQPVPPARAPRWRSGDPVPAGYHVEERPNYVLTAIGFSQFGAMWLFSAMIGLSIAGDSDGDSNAWELAIPLAGPMMQFNDTEGDFEALLDMMLVMDLAVQIVGFTLGVVGLSSHREVLVAGEAQVTVGVGPGGAAVRVTF